MHKEVKLQFYKSTVYKFIITNLLVQSAIFIYYKNISLVVRIEPDYHSITQAGAFDGSLRQRSSNCGLLTPWEIH